MKKKTIYSNQSQELLRLFEEAGNNSKMMCVPIDYAMGKPFDPVIMAPMRPIFEAIHHT